MQDIRLGELKLSEQAHLIRWHSQLSEDERKVPARPHRGRTTQKTWVRTCRFEHDTGPKVDVVVSASRVCEGRGISVALPTPSTRVFLKMGEEGTASTDRLSDCCRRRELLIGEMTLSASSGRGA